MNPFSYQAYELAYLSMAPARAMSNAASFWAKNPLNPFAKTYIGAPSSPPARCSNA